MWSLSISERTQPMDPSPLQMRIRKGSKWRKSLKPRPGPPFIRSKTWAGLRSCLNRRRNFTPWLSPDFELTKTNNGEQPCGRTASQASSVPKAEEIQLRKTKFNSGAHLVANNESSWCTNAMESRGWNDADPARSQRTTNWILRPARCMDHCSAPQASPILQPATQLRKKL